MMRIADAAPETRVSTDLAIQAKAVELCQHVVRMTTEAGSGHASSALSLAHIVATLMYRHMRYDPAEPANPGSDRLLLSEGHAVPIVYAAYADLGGSVRPPGESLRPLNVADLADLRELASPLDGHPNPAEGFPFFDAATGSLGQGLSAGAGLALAARLDGIEKNIYVIIGDGESREGQIWEALDFIIDHDLGNVLPIFNCNGQGQADYVSAQQSPEKLADKLAAYGFDVQVVDGHDVGALSACFGRLAATGRPMAVVARTKKGWGVSALQPVSNHGRPLSKGKMDEAIAELKAAREAMGRVEEPGRPPAPRVVAASASRRIRPAAFERGVERAGLLEAFRAGRIATRQGYGAALVALGDADPRVVVLDGDVKNSTFTELFAKFHPGRFFECKIAEQNMVSVAVGLSAAGYVPFASSFAKFLTRAYDQVEMAGISRANIKLVGSHSGVSLAADGPSQMSLPDVAFFRSFSHVDVGGGRPACVTFHPADAVAAYEMTLLMAEHRGMCYMRTHRPVMPLVYEPGTRFEIGGSHQHRDGKRLTLVAAGYMLSVVLDAADRLAERGISCNVFDAYSFPLRAEPIITAAGQAGGRILTVEDNYAGGLQAAVAEAAARQGQVRVEGLFCRRFPKSGRTADDLLAYLALSQRDIEAAAVRLAGD